jgi:hypothetical protein
MMVVAPSSAPAPCLLDRAPLIVSPVPPAAPASTGNLPAGSAHPVRRPEGPPPVRAGVGEARAERRPRGAQAASRS